MKEINGVIREDIIVTDSDDGLKLGSEVRFEGGVIRYTGTGTLNVYGGGVIDNEDDVNDGVTYGEGGTNIVAGDYQIFYGNAFAFKGKWNIKGIAYASWFGLEDSSATFFESKNISVNLSELRDNSVHINQTIKLKGSGEVRIPAGIYAIRNHIKVLAGIQLIGETSGFKQADFTRGTVLYPYVEELGVYSSYSSYLRALDNYYEDKETPGKYWINLKNIPFPLPTESYSHVSEELSRIECGYMIIANINDDVEIVLERDDSNKIVGINYFKNNVELDYSSRRTRISGISLVYWESMYSQIKTENNTYETAPPLNHHYRGILYEGGIEIDNVQGYGLMQLCANAGRNYSDHRYIHDCTYGLGENKNYVTNIPSNHKIYAFDLRGLGDALNFHGNHDSSYHNLIGSLRIDSCYGGVIEGNILNSDVMINQCCGVTFNGNHCEYGIKLDVRGSSVSICDNIFWKGAHPTIRIRRIQSPITVYQQAVTLRNNTFYYYMRAGALSIVHNINSTCEYDVATDGWSNIVVENCFRSRFNDNVNEFTPTGIKVGLLKMYEEDTYYWDVNEVSDLPEFNNYSHINSLQSVISGQRVSFGGNKGLCLGSSLSGINISLNEIAASTSIYKRYYSKQGSTVQYTVYDMYDVERDLGKKIVENQSITLNQPNSLVNINLPEDLYYISRVKMLKVVRLLDGVHSSVCIPLCGAAVLTDDGSNINGYPWVEFSSLLKIDPQEVSSLNYKGDNVECTMSERPISGTWVDGDVVWVGSLTLVRYERRGIYWYKVTTTTGS